MGSYVISQKVGKRIRLARRRLGMTQLELGIEARLHSTTVGRIERGELNPTLPTLQKIAKGLRMKTGDLLS